MKLVRAVGDKMKGFSRRESVDYYKSIMERAWQQVESADTPEVKSRMLDEVPRVDDARQGLRRPHAAYIHRTCLCANVVGTLRPDLEPHGRRRIHPEHAVCSGRSRRWITRFSVCCFSGHGNAAYVQRRDRQREYLHQRRDQRHQPAASTLAQRRQLSWRRRLCLRLRLRRVRLRLRRRWQVENITGLF